ncbi:hypothetical protein FISHEDRAFT_35749 [Fistulina hepatica ATCC 64428]|uniref:Methyltransferase domain-containing protein n=1 Tax=Fistulina hepatica ATCC 64428 TaxID=1128425 RepID=A0A0D7AKV1_9AGAR|nr:hypothetical protein FISHEDRAFT_35749 [Fistulina hepatica ATCC 64428]
MISKSSSRKHPEIKDICNLVDSELLFSLMNIHPNDDVESILPRSWLSWWHWAAEDMPADSGDALHDAFGTPQRWPIRYDLRQMVMYCEAVKFDLNSWGMSPKKAHEVLRLTTYIADLLCSMNLNAASVRIVDVGAGQGYLTRALKLYVGSRHLLALDSDDAQTRGAQKAEDKLRIRDGSITHKTVHITSQNLIQTVNEWIAEDTDSDDAPNMPVLFVALHACGSLTPTILRSLLEARRKRRRLRWTPIGVIAVGCCYNLLSPEADFPLSGAVRSARVGKPPLPSSAYHLAAQIPDQWARNAVTWQETSLAVRKVAWRALLGRNLKTLPAKLHGLNGTTRRMNEVPSDDSSNAVPKPLARVSCLGTTGTGNNHDMRRLGRLNHAAYASWDIFCSRASEKIGVSIHDYERDSQLERQLQILHVLRCLCGPLVESLFVLDRVRWFEEQLATEEPDDGPPLKVDLVNIFDQETGSGRNIAFVISPSRR